MAITSILSSLPAGQAANPAAPASFASAGTEPAGHARPSAAQTTEAASKAQIEDAVHKVREALPPVARNLQFSLDQDTGHTVVKVMDSSTNEVIRQIPTEEFLRISRSLDVYNGLLLRQKA